MKKITWIMFFVALVVFISESAFCQGNVVRLPEPKRKGEVSIEQAIFQRRSVRSFTQTPLTMEDVSQLLWSPVMSPDWKQEYIATTGKKILLPS